MSRVYDFNQYDKYLSLRPSIELWCAVLYFLRPYIVLLAARGDEPVGIGASSVRGIRQILYPDNFSLTLGIIATIPAIVFLYAWSRRKPGAHPAVVTLWHNGAHLLLLASVLNIVVVFVPFFAGIIARVHALGWVQVGVALLIIAYVYLSPRARDTFSDFPVERPA